MADKSPPPSTFGEQMQAHHRTSAIARPFFPVHDPAPLLPLASLLVFDPQFLPVTLPHPSSLPKGMKDNTLTELSPLTPDTAEAAQASLRPYSVASQIFQSADEDVER